MHDLLLLVIVIAGRSHPWGFCGVFFCLRHRTEDYLCLFAILIIQNYHATTSITLSISVLLFLLVRGRRSEVDCAERIRMMLHHFGIQVHQGQRFPRILLTPALLDQNLLIDISEEFEVDKLLTPCHKIQRVFLGLATIDLLTKWIVLEPLVQRLLARIIFFRMFANRQERLCLL